MADRKMNWAMPVMRAGYAGRAATYLAISGLSLWAVFRGGDAKGTSGTMEALGSNVLGLFALYIIAAGLLAYMIWRLIDAVWDFECHGTDAKGVIARSGMVSTGLIHGVLGIAALALAIGYQSGNTSGVVEAVDTVMSVPLGEWLVGLGGLVTAGAGLYYIRKGWTQSYLDALEGNHFTRHWNPALRLGVMTQGLTVLIIGCFFVFAGVKSDPSKAGGLQEIFEQIRDETFGQIMVVALCFGLLAFALFMLVNARYRIIPRLSDPSIKSLKAQLT